jgi:penicillin-binding protein 1C
MVQKVLMPLMRMFKMRRARIALGACIGVMLLMALLPGPASQFRAPFSFVLLDSSGALLGARIAPDEQWRFPLAESVPEKFARAIVAQEDKRFWHHPGVDPLAMFRALLANLKAGRIMSGGSTITMQVIRLSRRPKPRTIAEKLVECLLAVRLELFTRKSTVLRLYTGHAPFGGNIVGLQAASWRYFGRPPERLSWAETATLAVLPNEPAIVHPGRNRAGLLRKRDTLLRKLLARGVIDSAECRLALSEPLEAGIHALPRLAPHLLERMRSESSEGTMPRVRSTIQADLQQRVAAIVKRHAARLRENSINNAAALVVEVDGGRVLAYVGNALDDMQDSLWGVQVDCIRAPRSTGSVLKPFLYAAMLDAGEILPTSLVPDIPTNIGGFTPQNFNRQYEGAVAARKALARSLNVPAVRMLIRYGVGRFHHMLQSLGMTTVTRGAGDYGISLILGGAEATLWELAGIYASMARCVNVFHTDTGSANEGAQFMPVTAAGMEPNKRTSLPLSAAACWCAFEAMEEVVRPGEEEAWREFSSSRRIAWKTGTSFGFRDAWAIGVTPKYVVAVWVGNASGEGRPGLIGIHVAGPVLFDIYNALPPTLWFSMPEAQLRRIEVCSESGYLPGPHCESFDTVWAPDACRTMATCPYHHIIHLDKTGAMRVSDGCERVGNMQHRSWFILPPVIESYYRRLHYSYRMLPPFRDDCRHEPRDNPIGIVYPHAGSKVYVPIEITGAKGRVVFEAAHRNPAATLYWHLDGDYLGSTTGVHEIAANPPPGEHRLVLVDNKGNSVARKLRVIAKEEARR